MPKLDAATLDRLAWVDRQERADPLLSDEVRAHELRVARLSARLAGAAGMDGPRQAQVFTAARFHDAGKLSVPSAVLFKPGRLTADERLQMARHTALGVEILADAAGALQDDIHDAVRYHHERYDGNGYERLAGERIPLVARIVAIADVYDALSATRSYKDGMAPGDALAKMAGDRGAFDPFLLRAFVARRLRDAPPDAVTPGQRAALEAFSLSDPMDDVAPGGPVTIKRSGHRIFWFVDGGGNRKQSAVMHPDGRMQQVGARETGGPASDPRAATGPGAGSEPGLRRAGPESP
jgi:HD superfamily phosphohydrolase YqeK